MSGGPELGVLTKLQLAAFAYELEKKYPQHASTILSLQDSLESKLDKNPQLQNDIIRKLNNDTGATLAKARAAIDKDPNILNEINKDPTKLGPLMGVKVAAPTPSTPATSAKPDTTPTQQELTTADKPAQATVKSDAEEPAPATVTAIPSVPLPDEVIALRKQVAEESLKVTQMKGFPELAERAKQSQSLSQAIDAMMGKDAATPQGTINSLKKIQSDPEFFVKANTGIDEIPEQAREMVFTEIAADPELGYKALAGDEKAKSELMMKSTMGVFGLGSLFSSGPDGKGGLGSLFSGEGMKGLGEMIQKIIPALMDMLKGVMTKLAGGLQEFLQSPDLMRMGNNPEGTRDLAASLNNTLGIDGNQRVVDATKPDEPAIAVAQLGQKPESPSQNQQLEAQRQITPSALGSPT